MSIVDYIEKLIIEHGSSTILRDHLALLKEQTLMLEKEIVRLTSENANLMQKITVLQSENQALKTKVENFEKENAKLRSIVQKYQQPNAPLLDKEETEILLFLFNHHSDALTFQIAKSLNLSEDIAKYHLEELHQKKFIRISFPIVPGQDSWTIEQKGKKYLVENKLIS
jgi:predicted nuclease with TOPRIM domain